MQRLKRSLGFWSSVAIAIGGMIGAGIFVLLGIGAGIAGPALPIAFVAAGLVAFFNAASASELGAAYPMSGGTYEYARRLISDKAAFLTGFIFTVSKLLESATVALAFGFYASVFLGYRDPRPAALAAVALFTSVNYVGLRLSAELNNVFVAIKVAVLALLVYLASGRVSAANFSGLLNAGPQNVITAAALLFFAYTGYARISTLGEEVKDPKRTIPMATMAALGITVAIYVLVSVTSVGAVGSAALSGSTAPLAAVAAMFGNAMVAAVAIGALVATASVLLGDLLASSRTMFAMGRYGDLPAALGLVHKGHGGPYVADLASGAVVAGIVAIGNLPFSAFLTSLTILLYYTVTNICAIRLKAMRLLYPRFLSVLGAIGCVFLAAFVPLGEWIATGVLLLAGAAYYRIRAKR